MRNYIILNNQRSDEIDGLIIQELAPISKPLQRTQVETIDGRDGDIVTPLGYAAYDKKITIGLYGDFDINEIIAYFATQGTAIFSNEPDKYYNYQILDQIDYERLVRFRVATVTMHVQPFKYSATEGTLTIDASDTVSGEGSDIALDNTAEAPFTTLRHKGNATQKTYTGKNLLDVGNNLKSSSNGVIPSYAADGTLTWTGTPTASWAYITNDFNVNLPAGTYTFSINHTLSHRIYLFYRLADNSTNYWVIEPNTLKSTITFTQAVIKLRLDLSGLVIGQTYNESVKAMVEAGSSATDYEIFVGGTASPNTDYPQDISVLTGDSSVKITGKNLLDFDDFLTIAGATYTKSADKYNITAVGSLVPTRYELNVIAGETYTISCEKATQSTSNPRMHIFKNGTHVGSCFFGGEQQSASYSFTAESGSTYAINLTYSSPFNSPIIVSKPQLETGDQTTYEPYKEQSYVIPFGNTYLAKVGNYADEPVKVGDTWYIRRAVGKVVFDGSTTLTQLQAGTNTTRVVANVGSEYGAPLSTVQLPLCDYFTGNSSVWSTDIQGTYIQGRYVVLRANNATVGATLDSFKTWLTSHPTTVYYVLAETTDEEIADQDLIDALDEFYGQAHSYKGHTHIAATAADGNAPAILSVEVGEDNESTVTNAGNTASRPILTIYGQGDIGVYINDVEVLDIALGNEQYITLDSTEMDAYKDSPANLKNRLVTGDYSKLALNAGANKIRFTGNVTKYEISKYSRWL